GGVSSGSVSTSGKISGGTLTRIAVLSDTNGQTVAQGMGTINNVSIGGSLGGNLTAVEDPNPGSGTISGVSSGSVSTSGKISGGTERKSVVKGDRKGTRVGQGRVTKNNVSIGGGQGGELTG